MRKMSLRRVDESAGLRDVCDTVLTEASVGVMLACVGHQYKGHDYTGHNHIGTEASVGIVLACEDMWIDMRTDRHACRHA